LSAAALTAYSGLAAAQSGSAAFPTKPLRIVTSEAGGGNDVLSRIIAQGISPALGQPVIVENKASGLEVETLAIAQPDAYTMVCGGSTLWLSELLQKDWRYRVFRDYVPVSLVTTAPLLLLVNPTLPVNSVAELVALAKAKPGALNYGSGAVGASSHLGPELFKAMAGVNIVRVPYKGTGPAYNALAANEVQVMVSNAGSAVPYIKSGKIKALAVTSAEPSVLFPGMPTVAQGGVPGYESVVYEVVFTTGHNTPESAVRRLNQEIVKVIRAPELRAKLLGLGVEAVGSTPEEAAVKIRAEMARIGKVIKDQNIHAD
jgi:tripartite-type tricarboxylate transporter receptor subunit TctC